MSEQFDRYNLAARLEKFGDRLMTACEQGKAIESRIDVCAQAGTVCRIAMTLKALRMEDRRSAEPDDDAGSMVRKYSNAFAAETHRVTSAGSTAEPASDDDPCWADPDAAEE